ncbi:carbohydrate kinase family protein [Fictibacillus sp. 18YEL24]|uniref:carbohydrate kinase family protein n=1 Tax=Fictibacillus sp. 18YEL24 TaxID=2745875 RepID=UPI0018CD24FC|nr:carbohydrate kinase [Fictibacillus sp. 18YEL24]MBH0168331.1 carbohydrate kinase [Fictibacillus sp. 18YEL24]
MIEIDVIAIGELLIDFTPAGTSANGNTIYEQNPGGAPANVVAALGKWGRSTSMIARVGDDFFGEDLITTLKEHHIDCSLITRDVKIPTTLAFVKLDEDGNRSFRFYRKPGADLMLCKEDIEETDIKRCKVFHFGSVSLTGGTSREATWHAVERAIENSKIISFDPNIRELLWEDHDEMKEQIKRGLSVAHLVKMSEEELQFVTSEKELEKAAKLIAETYSIPLLIITLGALGSYYMFNGKAGFVPGYRVRALDTTGAGDVFWASVLHQLLERIILLELKETDIRNIIQTANAVGALSTFKKGAIPSIPTVDEIEQFFHQHQRKMEDKI